MSNVMRNSEGYPDPTVGAAMGRMERQRKRKLRRNISKSRRKKIYVASRYAGDVEANISAARKYMRYVIENGGIPIASHVLYHGIIDEDTERDMGLRYGRVLLSLCDEVWCFGDISSGMRQEIETAQKIGIPVKYFEAEVVV